MNRIFKILTVIFVVSNALFIFSTCSQTPANNSSSSTASSSSIGTKYGYYKVGVGNLKSLHLSKAGSKDNFTSISKAVITIVDSQGQLVTDSDVVELFDFGGTYLSASIQIPAGTYKLTRYLIADSYNRILYATPITNSLLAANVANPLPIEFTVSESATTNVIADIIQVYNHTGTDFGYAGFTLPTNALTNQLPFPSQTTIYSYSIGSNGNYLYGYQYQGYFSYYGNNGNKNYNTVDGQMNNGDDVVTGWWKDQSNANFGSWQSGAGADGQWFTSDDVIQHWEDWTVSSYHTIYTAAGPDGIWFTSDDIQTECYKDSFDAEGNTVRRVHYTNAGANGIWNDSDDVIGPDWFGCWYTNFYDGTNNRWWSWTKQIRYDGPGPGGVWLTANDHVKEWVVHEFSDTRFSKFWTKETYYTDAGPDGIMFTADDVPYQYNIATNIQ